MTSEPPASHSAQSPAVAERTAFGDRYRLEPTIPLPALSSPHAEAFAARDTRAPERQMFALVCRKDLAPRLDLLSALPHHLALPLLMPVEWGTAFWPPADGQRFLILFDRPGGERLVSSASAAFAPLSEERIKRAVVGPLLPLLDRFRQRGLTHRAIRADNLFYRDQSCESVLLGECVSAPAGLGQPAVYETIEGAMAMPSGRGAGTAGDDLYALGVTVAILHLGRSPLEGLNDKEVVSQKIGLGSYAAVTGRQRVSMVMTELLRGLLCDDPTDRWTVDDLDAWVNGRHLAPKQILLPPRAGRPFIFAGQEHWTARSLAHAMAGNWSEALALAREKPIDLWIGRSVGDGERADAIRTILADERAEASSAPGAGEDCQLARLLIELDPHAPLRFKDFAAPLDGFASALAADFHRAGVPQAFVSVLNGRLHEAWAAAQLQSRPEVGVLRKRFDAMRAWLNRPGTGFGVERCLYEANPGWPCLSPLLEGHYVVGIDEVLPALEHVAEQGPADREPIDQHIAAFCAARLGDLPGWLLAGLSNRDDLASRRLAMLELLAMIQRRAGPDSLPRLASWLGGLLDPVVETYHSRAYRNALSGEIRRIAARGDLAALWHLAADPDARLRDEQGFAQARHSYRHAAQELDWLQRGGLLEPQYVAHVGRQAAAALSGILSGICLLLFALVQVS